MLAHFATFAGIFVARVTWVSPPESPRALVVGTYNLPMAVAIERRKKWGWQKLVEVQVEHTLATRELLHRTLEACSPP